MEVWLRLGRGPLFWSALVFMLLGLARQAALTGLASVRAYRRAGDRDMPAARVVSDTAAWLVPTGRLKDRWLYSLTTFAFHVGVILVPLFLAGHIELWREALGVGWPALPNPVATVLTVVVLVAAVGVVAQRLASAESRTLSRFQDYLVPLLVAVPFLSGLLVMHPTWNPFTRDATLLVHVLSGDLVLFLVPLTKLSHMVLLPLTQLVSELAWHFPPDAGERVGRALGKESEPV